MNFQTKDWSLAHCLSYVSGSLPFAVKRNGKSIFIFRIEDSHPEYTFEQLKALYYSEEGLAISNAREFALVAKDVRAIALSAKEES